ncbi:hypothetical protein FQN53_004944 [Emmonsiellopsis sp. PD_33]|nr:hypothetical protein FQN53_004944 [Emmonsiellopsis sp. PD_33]
MSVAWPGNYEQGTWIVFAHRVHDDGTIAEFIPLILRDPESTHDGSSSHHAITHLNFRAISAALSQEPGGVCSGAEKNLAGAYLGAFQRSNSRTATRRVTHNFRSRRLDIFDSNINRGLDDAAQGVRGGITSSCKGVPSTLGNPGPVAVTEDSIEASL